MTKEGAVPEVDFAVVCDYLREEAGVMHMLAAGIDRIRPPTLPAALRLGVGVRLALTREECERPHEVKLLFKDPDGEQIAEVRGGFRVDYPANVPEGWPAYATLAPNFLVPLQAYGPHRFELFVDDEVQKIMGIIVEPLQEA
jgi:hypothetical protein